MSDARITRLYRNLDITLTTNASSATTIDLRDVAGAVVSLGTISTNETTLQMWGAPSTTGTFRRLYKADGTVADLALNTAASSGATYALPDEVYGVAALRVVSGSTNSSGIAGVVGLKS